MLTEVVPPGGDQPQLPPTVDALIEKARTAERASRHGFARRCYEQALHRLRHADHAPSASSLLRWIGRTYDATGDFEAALDCYEAALAVALACGDTTAVAYVLNLRAIIMFQRGRLMQAERLYREARRLAGDAGEWKLVAMVDQNLGNVANVHGDRDATRVYYNRSLERYRELGLEEYVGPLLNNVGRLHTDVGAWGEAEETFALAIESCERVSNPSYRVLIDVNLTRLYLCQNDLARARAACDDALETSMALGDNRWLGEIHKHMGVICLKANQRRQAEESFRTALKEAESREDLLLEAEITQEMARLFRLEERNREVLECLNRAHEVFATLRAQRDLAVVDVQIARLEESFTIIVREWGDSIESKDHYTQGHCERVADRACELAIAAGLSPHDLTWFRMGALLHDVGKVSVPAEILNKPGPLDDDEWAIMKRHPEAGVELLANVEFPWDVRPMVLHHHEQWNGKGYPHGLAGTEIPLPARILCVADVFDALTTIRSYRAAFPPRRALQIMENDTGHVFDPDIFDLFKANATGKTMPKHRDRSLRRPSAERVHPG